MIRNGFEGPFDQPSIS